MKFTYYSLIAVLPALLPFGRQLRVFTHYYEEDRKWSDRMAVERYWSYKWEKNLVQGFLGAVFAVPCPPIRCIAAVLSHLLLDVSYGYDRNDKTKDCFEYNLGNTEAVSWKGREPIDCNSTAVQNGTVEVECYKFVFNFGVALGASYGTFQFSLFVLSMATSV